VLPVFAPAGEVLPAASRRARPLLYRQKAPKPVTPRPSHLIDRTLNTGERTNSRCSNTARQEKERPIMGRVAGVGVGEMKLLESGYGNKSVGDEFLSPSFPLLF
jgi:hypothetical protein